MLFNKFSLGPKLPKNKKFNYMPIYYDENKEALEKRIKKVKGSAIAGEEQKTIKFERRASSIDSYDKGSILRTALIAIAITILIFWIFR